VGVDMHDMRSSAKQIIDGDCGVLPDWADDSFMRGDLLPDSYDEWVVAERERLRQLRLHALEAICRRHVELGCFPQATEAALTAVSIDPLRESAHLAVIQAHLAEGDNAEALRQYRLLERVLRDQLGLAPSNVTRESVGTLLRFDGGRA
jgi:DNA-binding SARP family transcriptional activator